MKSRRILLIVSVLSISLSSCYYDNVIELYPNAECDTLNVGFSSGISEIIYQSCATTGCHVAGTGRVLLTNYAEVKLTIDNGQFVQRAINARDMPPEGPLSSCEIKKLTAWINNGALND